jgi:outer membrane murein-binding lipoprotein Lpp
MLLKYTFQRLGQSKKHLNCWRKIIMNLNLTTTSTFKAPQTLLAAGHKQAAVREQKTNTPSIEFGMGPGMFPDIDLGKAFKAFALVFCAIGAAVGVGTTLLIKGCTSSAPTQQVAPPQTDAEKIKELQEQVKKLQEAKSSETDKK